MARSDDFDLWRDILQIIVGLAGTTVATLISLLVFEIFHGSNLTLSLLRSRKEAQLAPVLMFVQDVPLGAIIGERDIRERIYPTALVPADALLDRKLVVGRTLKERALAGDLIRPERLADFDGDGIDALVPPGERALMLQLSPSAHVSGSVIAGDVVDVLYTVEGETVTLLSRVRVLAATERVHTLAFDNDVVISQVILSLPPTDAEKVTHALALGSESVRLTLVGDEEAGDLPELLPPPSQPQDPLKAKRMDVAEFRRAFDEASVQRMYQALEGTGEEPLPAVDPVLVRQIELPDGLMRP